MFKIKFFLTYFDILINVGHWVVWAGTPVGRVDEIHGFLFGGDLCFFGGKEWP